MAEKLGTVGVLDILIGGSSALFERSVEDAERKVAKLGGNLADAARAGTMFAAAAAAAGAAVFALANNVATAQDEIGKAAEKSGMAVEEFSGLKYAADISNVSMESLGTALRQLSKNMLDASANTGDAKDALKALNVEVSDSSGRLRPTREVLLDLADKFRAMKGSTEATAYAMKIFGRSGADLIPFLNEGRAGIDALTKEAERLGVVVSAEAAQAADEFKDNLTRLQGAVTGLKYELAGPLVEALGKTAKAFLDAKRDGESFFSALAAGVQTALTGDDAHKLNVRIEDAFNQYQRSLQALDNARQQARDSGNAPFDVDQVKRFTEEVAKAKIQLDTLLAIKPVLAPEAPAGAKGGTTPPKLITEEQKKAEIKAYEDQMREFNKMEAERYRLQLAAAEKAHAEQVAAEAAFQQQRIDLQNFFAAKDAENGQALLERRRMLKEFEYKTDEERENEAHASKMARIGDFTNDELAALGGRQAVVERMEQEHQQRLVDIRSKALTSITAFTKASWQQQTRTIIGELANMTAGVANSNRTLFELNKVAGIANAIVNAYVGISRTLAAYPYPWNIALAAAHAVTAFAQVQQIRAQSFGTGGAAPSIAGSTAAPAVSPVASGAPAAAASSPSFTGTLTVQGISDDELFSGGRTRALVERLIEAQRQGYRIVLDN